MKKRKVTNRLLGVNMSRKAVLERTLGKKAAKKFMPPKPSKAENIQLELPTELLEQIVIAELIAAYQSMAGDLKARRDNRGMAVFDLDKEIDIKTMEGHLFCFETVLKYYGAPLK